MARRNDNITVGFMGLLPRGLASRVSASKGGAGQGVPKSPLSDADIQRRRTRAKAAIADSAMEGLKASPRDNALLYQFAEGRITREQYFEAISADDE